VNQKLSHVVLLILLAGDVATNPGPGYYSTSTNSASRKQVKCLVKCSRPVYNGNIRRKTVKRKPLENSTYFLLGSRLFINTSIAIILLRLSGDIESNPGPVFEIPGCLKRGLKAWAYRKEKIRGAERNLPDFFGLCPSCQKKFPEKLSKIVVDGGGEGGMITKIKFLLDRIFPTKLTEFPTKLTEFVPFIFIISQYCPTVKRILPDRLCFPNKLGGLPPPSPPARYAYDSK
jgi:hypothetical protein